MKSIRRAGGSGESSAVLGARRSNAILPPACARASVLFVELSRAGLAALLFLVLRGAFAGDKIDCDKMPGGNVPQMRAHKLCIADQLEPVHPARREWYAESYDPKKYRECVIKEPNNYDCDWFRLKRVEQPEHWPYAGKVPAFRWPEAPKQSVYRKGMTGKAYFDALCKEEAGEFVYKRAKNVEGIYELRPRVRATDYDFKDKYVLEDPFGVVTVINADNVPQVFTGNSRYRFFETPSLSKDGARLLERVVRVGPHPKKADDILRRKDMAYEVDSVYGYTWRGINRLADRQMGIAGGELAIIDLRTNALIALRRGFLWNDPTLSRSIKTWWPGARICPNIRKDERFATFYFVLEVLEP